MFQKTYKIFLRVLAPGGRPNFGPPPPREVVGIKIAGCKTRAKGYAWRAWLHCKQNISFTVCLWYTVFVAQ